MKRVILSIIPFFVWLLWFISKAIPLISYEILPVIELSLLISLPVVFTLANFLVSKDAKSFLRLNVISLMSNIAGNYSANLLYSCLINNNDETELVINAFLVLLILYSVILTSICFLVKKYF